MMLRRRQEEEEEEAEKRKEQQQQDQTSRNVRRKLLYGSPPEAAAPISATHINVYDETLSKDVPLVRRGTCSAAAAAAAATAVASPFLVANDFYTWTSAYIRTLPAEVIKQVALEEAAWREKECPRLSQVIRVLITPSA